MAPLHCFEEPPRKVTNKYVDGGANFDTVPDASNIHMLIVALDYKKTSFPLTCTMDAQNIQCLAGSCGVQDVTRLIDEQASKASVCAEIVEVCARCKPEDYFVFYYAGHGDTVKDEDGDEDDGLDEAMVLVDASGKFHKTSTYLIDDEFAEVITSNIPEGVRVVIIMDCCHSGTIADLDKECWEDIEAVCISGCLDSQTSGDTGKGGIFTHSLLLAIDNLQKHDEDEYSVGMAYNMALKYNQDVFASAQDITIHLSPKSESSGMPWPLIPFIDYDAPMKKARRQKRAISTSEEVTEGELESMGVKASLKAYAHDDVDLDIDVQTIPKAGKCGRNRNCCIQ